MARLFSGNARSFVSPMIRSWLAKKARQPAFAAPTPL
jgi:hypothetical protein